MTAKYLQYPEGGFFQDIALGNYIDTELWNKFGYNTDISIGTEVVASFGGTFVPLYVASRMSLVSTSDQDALGGTGSGLVYIYGVDEEQKHRTELVELTGTTPVVTFYKYFTINRIAIAYSGTNRTNVGTITGSATSDASVQAQIPAGVGTTQQCIYHCAQYHKALMHNLHLNTLKTAGGAQPIVIFKAYSYSWVTNTKYEIFRHRMDTAKESHAEYAQAIPFVIDGRSNIWFEATTDKDNTEVNIRFSLIQSPDPTP